MNIIDIVIIVCLAASALWGLKDGAIRQLGTLVGIIVAIILAKKFGTAASILLGIGGTHAHIWGYIIVLFTSLIVVTILAILLRKIVSAVGLGIVDRILGAVISLLKSILILSIIISIVESISNTTKLIDTKSATDESLLYGYIASSKDYIMPTIDWVSSQAPTKSDKNE